MRGGDSREGLGLPAPRAPATVKVRSSTPTTDRAQKHTAEGTRAWKIPLMLTRAPSSDSLAQPQSPLPLNHRNLFHTNFIPELFYTNLLYIKFLRY